jgi:hypothetical protein
MEGLGLQNKRVTLLMSSVLRTQYSALVIFPSEARGTPGPGAHVCREAESQWRGRQGHDWKKSLNQMLAAESPHQADCSCLTESRLPALNSPPGTLCRYSGGRLAIMSQSIVWSTWKTRGPKSNMACLNCKEFTTYDRGTEQSSWDAWPNGQIPWNP